jgi:hypothetical protein
MQRISANIYHRSILDTRFFKMLTFMLKQKHKLIQKLQLTTEDAEEIYHSKRRIDRFYDFLCALFYARVTLIISPK